MNVVFISIVTTPISRSTLRAAVAQLRLANTETIAADYVSASVAVVTGIALRQTDRIKLLTQAIGALHGPTAGRGGAFAVSA